MSDIESTTYDWHSGPRKSSLHPDCTHLCFGSSCNCCSVEYRLKPFTQLQQRTEQPCPPLVRVKLPSHALGCMLTEKVCNRLSRDLVHQIDSGAPDCIKPLIS